MAVSAGPVQSQTFRGRGPDLQTRARHQCPPPPSNCNRMA